MQRHLAAGLMNGPRAAGAGDVDRVCTPPHEKPEGSRPENSQSNKNGDDNQDDLERVASGLGRWGDWLRGHYNCRGCGHGCAARGTELRVGRQFSSTFRTEASHDDLLVFLKF